MIKEGDSTDHTNYMTFEYFYYIFEQKMFGVESGSYEGASRDTQFITNESYLMASLDNNNIANINNEDETADVEDGFDVSNGRLNIYRAYLGQLDFRGHEMMDEAFEELGGKGIGHAHNAYLQIAYDHGIFTGAIFLIFIIASIIRAFIYYYKNREEWYSVLPILMIVTLSIVSVFEWTTHPCQPLYCVFLISITPLLYRISNKEG